MVDFAESYKLICVSCNIVIVMNIALPGSHTVQVVSPRVQIYSQLQISSFERKSRSHIKGMILPIVDVSLLQDNSEWNIFIIEILGQETTVKLGN